MFKVGGIVTRPRVLGDANDGIFHMTMMLVGNEEKWKMQCSPDENRCTQSRRLSARRGSAENLNLKVRWHRLTAYKSLGDFTTPFLPPPYAYFRVVVVVVDDGSAGGISFALLFPARKKISAELRKFGGARNTDKTAPDKDSLPEIRESGKLRNAEYHPPAISLVERMIDNDEWDYSFFFFVF